MTGRHSYGRTTLRHTRLALAAALAAGAFASGATAAQTMSAGGNPQAVPPILPSVTPADLRRVRIDEAAEARRSAYRAASTARYSGAEMVAFELEGISSLEVPRWHQSGAAAPSA